VLASRFGVRADVENFIIEGIRCKIYRFMVTVTKNNGAVVKVQNEGDYFSNSRAVLINVNPGEKVVLSDFIVGVGCEPVPRQLSTILTIDTE